MNDMDQAPAALREAMGLLPKGGRHWFIAATSLAYIGAAVGRDLVGTVDFAQAIADLPPVVARGGLYAWSAARVVYALLVVGQPERAKAFLDRIKAAAAMQKEDDLSFQGWLALARVYWGVCSTDGHLAAVVANARAAVAIFERAGDPLATATARFWQSAAAVAIGRHDEVEEAVARGLESAEYSGNSFTARCLDFALWWDRTYTREATEVLEPNARIARDPIATLGATAAGSLAAVYLRTGDAATAEAVVREALDRSRGMVYVEYALLALWARILLALGRASEALAVAQRALAMPVRNVGYTSICNPDVSCAQALMTLGRIDEARGAIRRARDYHLQTAAELDEPDRAPYLKLVEESAPVFALARELLGEGGEKDV
jgi:tetratricopeptide (TPR) repeat protein